MRICLVYDCLFPWTVGGAERWYRDLADRLVADGHEVTYLTRRQWGEEDRPRIPGVNVIAVSGADELYGADGNRRIGPTLRFGAGVLRHLVAHGREYDVVHMASFPYFSVLAAAAARRLGGYRLVIDWHEVWTAQYWREYLGAAGGSVGYAIQRLCVRTVHRPYCRSRLYRDRLVREGVRETPTVLEGGYSGPPGTTEPRPAQRSVVFAGRLIPEKNALAAVRCLAVLRDRGVEVEGRIFGSGPQLDEVREEIERLGLAGSAQAPGFVEQDKLDEAIATAACLLHPSSREGYGLVVVEAAGRGVPVIVAHGPDNASTELVESGVNGIVAPSAAPEDLADAVEAVLAAGPAMRESTCRWLAENSQRLSLDASLAQVAAEYTAVPAVGR